MFQALHFPIKLYLWSLKFEFHIIIYESYTKAQPSAINVIVYGFY